MQNTADVTTTWLVLSWTRETRLVPSSTLDALMPPATRLRCIVGCGLRVVFDFLPVVELSVFIRLASQTFCTVVQLRGRLL